MGSYFVEQQGNTTLIIYKLDQGEPLNHFLLQTLTQGTIRGLAKTEIIQRGMENQVQYEVEDCINMAQLLVSPINEKELVTMMFHLTGAMLLCQKNRIPFVNIFWSLDCMYVHRNSYEVRLVCHMNPLTTNNIQVSTVLMNVLKNAVPVSNQLGVRKLIEQYIHFYSDNSLQELNQELFHMLQHIQTSKQSSSRVALTGSLKRQHIALVTPEPIPQKGEPVVEERSTEQKHPQEEMPNSSNGETVVLNEAGIGMPYFVRNRSQERIPILKNSFLIGKERYSVDYCVPDNAAVSRCHAMIVTKDGRYYIKDMNSTNHTFVNNIKVAADTEIELVDGAKVVLGNEEFYFYKN